MTGLLDRLVYLSAGLTVILTVILAFIGAKLILPWAHGLEPGVPEITTAVSLIVIGVVLTVTTVASLIKSRCDPAARVHAGAVLATPPRDTAPPASSGRPLTRPAAERHIDHVRASPE